jgi:hypothetical protein
LQVALVADRDILHKNLGGATRWGLIAAAGLAFAVAGCVTTSMQGYADKDLPSQRLMHVAAVVGAPLRSRSPFRQV